MEKEMLRFVLQKMVHLEEQAHLSIAAYDPTGTQITSIDNENECWTDLVCIDGDGGFTFSVSDTEGCVYDTTITVNCPLPIIDSLSVNPNRL